LEIFINYVIANYQECLQLRVEKFKFLRGCRVKVLIREMLSFYCVKFGSALGFSRAFIENKR
jgi:hypothetical protein